MENFARLKDQVMVKDRKNIGIRQMLRAHSEVHGLVNYIFRKYNITTQFFIEFSSRRDPMRINLQQKVGKDAVILALMLFSDENFVTGHARKEAWPLSWASSTAFSGAQYAPAVIWNYWPTQHVRESSICNNCTRS